MAAALKRLIERGEAPVILDVRPPIHRLDSRRTGDQ